MKHNEYVICEICIKPYEAPKTVETKMVCPICAFRSIKPEFSAEDVYHMIKILILALLFLNVGCGRDDGGKAATDQTDTSKKAVVTESETSNALAVDELPACDGDNQHQLVYVTSEKKFYTCETSGWAKIDIDGPQGEKGNDGIAGSNGADGANGADGISDVVWTDKVTGKKWFIKTETNQYVSCGDTTPPAGIAKTYASPTVTDIQGALSHGLFQGLNVKIYYTSNGYIFSNDPTTLKTDFSANLWGVSLCTIL
jgi:hypothetical protein